MSKGIMKAGIIGAGGRGIRTFGQIFNDRDDIAVTALCDPNTVRMKEGSRLLTGRQALYTSVIKMVQKEKLDAVVITSPDYTHEANAVAALENGINVLIDKPLATTVKGCQNIIDSARKNKKTAMVGFNLRHAATLMSLKKIQVWMRL